MIRSLFTGRGGGISSPQYLNLISMGVRMEDAEYVNLFSDYCRLRRKGEKVSYIVAKLSEQYAISERKVYSIIKRFRSDCNLFAV